MSETSIPGGARCGQCGGDVQPRWRVCPMCGATLAPPPSGPPPFPPNMSAPGATAPVANASTGIPPVVAATVAQPGPGPVRAAQAEACRDRQWIGVGLLTLGILGLVGGSVMLFQSSTIDAMRFDKMLSYATVGGGLMLVLVIGGLVAMAPRGRDSSAMTTHVVLSTTVSILIGMAMAAVIAVASVIYMFNDCVRGCQGRPNTAPTYNAPANAPARMAPAPMAPVPKEPVPKEPVPDAPTTEPVPAKSSES